MARECEPRGLEIPCESSRGFCGIPPDCKAHHLSCASQGGSGCALVRYLDTIGWPDTAHTDRAAGVDAPARGPYFDGCNFFVNHRRIRTFDHEAEYQIPILQAFQDQASQEQGWPPWIENPLGRCTPADSERRLSNAIAQLNAHQTAKLIYFWVERHAQRVHWKLTQAAQD